MHCPVHAIQDSVQDNKQPNYWLFKVPNKQNGTLIGNSNDSLE